MIMTNVMTVIIIIIIITIKTKKYNYKHTTTSMTAFRKPSDTRMQITRPLRVLTKFTEQMTTRFQYHTDAFSEPSTAGRVSVRPHCCHLTKQPRP